MATPTLPEGANEETVVGDDRDPSNYTKKGKLKADVYNHEIERLQCMTRPSSR